MINDFKAIFFRNKVVSLNSCLSSILSELFNRTLNLDFEKELQIDQTNSRLIVRLILDLIEHSKVRHRDNEAVITELKKYIFNPSINRFFSINNKVELFVMLELSEEYNDFLKEENLVW